MFLQNLKFEDIYLYSKNKKANVQKNNLTDLNIYVNRSCKNSNVCNTFSID